MEVNDSAMNGEPGRSNTSTSMVVTDSTSTNPNPENNASTPSSDKMLYGVDECPPWYLCAFLGLQHCLISFSGNVTVVLIVIPAMCVTELKYVSEILGTTFFVAGLVTLLQCTLGVRLPIIQGSAFTFVAPTLSILALPQWGCPAADDVIETNQTTTDVTVTSANVSDQSQSQDLDNYSVWTVRMNEIQGAIIIASLFEILLGASGLIGILLRFIGPLAIAPTITLIGLSLFRASASFAEKNWYIALATSFLILLFSLYLRNVEVPCFFVTRQRKCSKQSFTLFSMFSVILATMLGWILCAILTASNAIPNDADHWSYYARTDVKISVLNEANWFRFPYPFQWGWPTISTSAVFGMLAGVLAGTVESTGDYYACSRLAAAPPPPTHAVNRGILMEGIGCVLGGMWGSGPGSTSYSENIGIIGTTKVGSRRVVLVAAIYLLVFGVFGKFGAVFVSIPDPVIGGVFLVMFGIITAVGVSNLQFVDMNLSRNICIFGFSLFVGITLPTWLLEDDNASKINTGSEVVDQIFSVLLSTSMFVGGLTGFILDNTVPGTQEARGMATWREHAGGEHQHQQHQHGDDGDEAIVETVHELRSPSSDCYDLPCGMSFIRRWAFFKFVPFCPTFLVDVKYDQTTNGIEVNSGAGVANDAAEISPVNVESRI